LGHPAMVTFSVAVIGPPRLSASARPRLGGAV
jgi:hypothetical protein